jgi:adenylate cyclase
MALEIEWKFVVIAMPARPAGDGVPIEQGYFSPQDGPAVRVRVKGAKSSLDVKAELPGSRGKGSPQQCREFVYPIPRKDADELLALAHWRIKKTRYRLRSGLEVDFFEGPHEGLVLAELEVEKAGPPPEAPRGWTWRDVSHDHRYVNRALAEDGVPASAPRCRFG